LLLLPFTSHTQQVNRDSLLQIIRDTTISQEERQKAGAEIIAFNKLLLKQNPGDTSTAFLDTIRQKIQLHNYKKNTWINILTLTVFDTTKSIKVRKEAIDMLIELDTKKTCQFLIDNIGKIYFPPPYFSADAEFKPYYIFYRLSSNNPRSNCSLITIIIQSLEIQKNDIEIMLIAALTQQILVEKELIKAFLRAHLQAHFLDYNHPYYIDYPSSILYDNLNRMRQYLVTK